VVSEFSLEPFQHHLVGPMSGGQKRRIALAAALLTEPELLILDEPTSEVDPNTRLEIFDKLFELASQGKTILVSTHLMDEAERCHYLTIMDEGHKVANGMTEDLKANLKAQVYSITGEDVHQLVKILVAQKEILQVTQVGLSLRVLLVLEVENAVQYLSGLVGQAYQVQKEASKIEDVFVSVTRKKSA
jgi:ABC-2 type transport system ATP-binding protein